MVKSSKGIRRRTRGIMSKPPRERGYSTLTRAFTKYEVGEKACIVIDPSIHKGQPHVRFHGQTGEIIGKRGAAYVLSVNEKGKMKTAIVRPEHLKKAKK
ncbi:MAG: 50S ribosomal protein L21e [Thermoplasmata archaeon]|nr:50S ribosomal protein L21e [Thermoplasmata archaeon]